LNAPTHELGKIYDKARDEYIKQIYSDGSATFTTNKDVRFGNKKEKEKRKTNEEYAEEGLSRYNKLLNDKGTISSGKIIAELGVNANKASAIKYIIEKKWAALSTPV
jgi:hypothetical protein